MKFLIENCGAGLLLDPGLGKTAITYGAFKVLRQTGQVKKMLVVAPLRTIHLVWPREQEKWEDFNDLQVAVLHGLDKAKALAKDADVYLINPEGLEWLFKAKKTRLPSGKIKVEVDLKHFKSLGFDVLVVDELAKFKHVGSVRFKTIKQILHLFNRRWGLTGSPAANGLMDLFGQCYILDLGRTFGPYITHFQSKYFDKNYAGYNWTIRPGAEAEIYERVSPLVLRMAAEDYLELPELINNEIWIDLPKNVQEIYNRLENDLLTKVGERVVTAATAAAASAKCRQVANGGLYLDAEVDPYLPRVDKTREWVNLHEEKIEALATLVDELQGEPLLVAYDFRHDLDRLQHRFGKDVPYIGGGTSTSRASELERLWNAGQLPLLLGHPQSIGHGLNLQQAGRHVAWHSMTWDYTLYDQFIRRVLRQGSTAKRVFVHHILARKTVDLLMLKIVAKKERVQDAFFDGLLKLAVYKSGDAD